MVVCDKKRCKVFDLVKPKVFFRQMKELSVKSASFQDANRIGVFFPPHTSVWGYRENVPPELYWKYIKSKT